MVKTYQRADILGGGESFKIAPMTNEEVTNSVTCFAVNGSVDSPVTVQSVFPDTSGFTVCFQPLITFVIQEIQIIICQA